MNTQGVTQRQQSELTTDDVRTAYRLFLGREAESDAVVEAWRACCPSYDRLRQAFLGSPEFQNKNPAPSGRRLLPLNSAALDVEWQADETVLAVLLAHVKVAWTRLGQERPHWSVLSSDYFSPENIGRTEGAFFASGARSRDALLGCLARHKLPVARLQNVFEFGCGLARVTPYLAQSFSRVTACDVSPTHLQIARAVVQRSGLNNISLRLADHPHFAMTEPFDLWCSQLVLQHNPPPVIALILQRCFSLLAPGGVAIFQVPTYAAGYRFNIADYLERLPSYTGIEVHLLPQEVIFRIAHERRCIPLEVWQDELVGPGWTSQTFSFQKLD